MLEYSIENIKIKWGSNQQERKVPLVLLMQFTIYIDFILIQYQINQRMQQYSTLPPRKYKFTRAIPKKYITNYFSIDLGTDNTTLYQYSIEFDPHIENDSTKKIYSVIMNAIEELKQKIGYISSRGTILYGTKNQNTGLIIKSKMKEKDSQTLYSLLIRKNNDLPLKQMLHSHIQSEKAAAMQVLNINTKQRLKTLDMVDVGKGKFYKRLKIIKQVFNNGFFVMKGYKYTTFDLNRGLCLQVDVFSRILRQSNLLEEINAMRMDQKSIEELEGAIVVARYGNFRTYEIISVDFNKSPMTKFVPHNKQHEVTYLEYYKEQYDLDITIKNQPLILSASRIQKLKNKDQKMEKIYHYIYLVPEFLSLVGLSDSQRNNSNLMKNVSEKTRVGPHVRMNKILENVQELNKTKGLFSIQNPILMNGFQMNHPLVVTGSGTYEPVNARIKIENKGVKQKAMFKDWFLFYYKEHEEQANQLEQSMTFAANSLGMVVNKPQHIHEDKIKAEDWVQAISEEIQYSRENNIPIPSIMVIIVGGIIKDEIYNEVKSLCTLKLQIPSQFVHIKKIMSLAKKNNLLSYATNLLLQMNVKVGKAIWSIPVNNLQIKNKVIATGGMSISKVGKKHSLGFVGTMSKDLTKVYNETKINVNPNGMNESLNEVFENWIKAFYQFNNKNCLPDILVFYREGISRAEISKNSQKEIQALRAMVDKAKLRTKFKNYNPQIIYITVNKQSTSRFYEGSNSRFTNPKPGSVIIDEMSSSQFFDFHLTPHSVDQSMTSSPSHFIVCYQEPKRTSREAIIELTYEQCYNYYNWKGSIKFPACLQNADRLAKMTGKTLKSEISFQNIMSRSYHFL